MAEEENEPRSELERKIKADGGGERDALLEKLHAEAAAVKNKMDSGVSPAEFAELEKVYRGLGAGSQVVAAVWRRFNPA